MILKNMDFDINLEQVKCPKCGKQHFVEDGFSDGNGGFFDVDGSGISDCMFRRRQRREYRDGILVNAEAFIPSPTKQYYRCAECGCRFSIEATYGLEGVQSTRVIDEDEEQRKRDELYKQAQEERQKRLEEERNKSREQGIVPGTSITGIDDGLSHTITLNTPITVQQATLGRGTKSEIDLGGLILNSDVVYTDEQIKAIEDMFGWKAKNKK